MAKNKKEKTSAYINSPLNNPMPNYNVYVMSGSERLLISIGSLIAGGLAGQIFYGGLFKVDGHVTMATHISNVVIFLIVGILAICFFTPIYKKNRLVKRSNILKRQFKDMLESLATSFSTGSNVQMSFETAASDLSMQYGEQDYIVIEIQEIINGIHQNINVEVMLKNFGERSGNEDILSFADVFDICYRKGGNMNSIIHRTRDVISDKMVVADEIETKLTSNKMQHNVMSIMPIVVVAMLRFTNEAFAENFATPLGITVNTIAIGIFIGSYILGMKIVDIKE